MSEFTIGISASLPAMAGTNYEDALTEVLGSHPVVGTEYFDPPSETSTGQVVKPDDIAGYDGVLALSPTFNAQSFSGDDRLAVIGRWGVGYDRIDVAACTAAGVLLAIATDAVRRPVAEAVVALALALAKCMFEKDRIVREGRWELRGASPAVDLYGKTFGMVGMGNIGADVFRLLAPFGLGRKLAFDPYVSGDAAAGLGVELVDLKTVFSESDFVSINTPLNEETRGMVNASLIGLMKPTAYLINTARGPVVVQDDLIAALQEHVIAGAGLDVFEVEPMPADNALTQLDNVILAPHSLAWTDGLYRDNTILALNNILEVFQGRIPKYTVNPEVTETPVFQRKLRSLEARWAAASFG
ncbi:MAG: NAD(P)-dependent oxidoreductase [Caldilineaceae bacterium]